MIKTVLFLVLMLQASVEGSWVSELENRFFQIEDQMPGKLGVYVKFIGDGHTLRYNSNEDWYLSSTVKIPLAIAILQRVEAGELSLDKRLTLQESNFVDGAGDLIRQQPGTTYTIRTLLEKMIRNSDSSATDMLFDLIGEEDFNEQLRQQMVARGFHKITSLLQVRYEAYSQIHENARGLTNIDFIELRKIPTLDQRLIQLIDKMAIDKSEMKAQSIFDAFERYYETKLNSATLDAMGLLLERLYNRELLSEENTVFLLNSMQNITTGERRIKAGLPAGTTFAQKTGTQIRNACNVGIVFTNDGQAVIVAACVKGNDLVSTSEQALQNVGKALWETIPVN